MSTDARAEGAKVLDKTLVEELEGFHGGLDEGEQHFFRSIATDDVVNDEELFGSVGDFEDRIREIWGEPNAQPQAIGTITAIFHC